MHLSQSSLEQESMSEEINTGYEPREPQKEIHKAVKDNRWTVAVAPPYGKNVAAINQLIHSALQCERKAPQFAYIAPTYGQAKRIAWDYLVDYTRPLGGIANVANFESTLWVAYLICMALIILMPFGVFILMVS